MTIEYCKVLLQGRLGQKPTIIYLANGKAATTLRLAVNRSWKERHSGERKEETTWHSVVCYEKIADYLGEHADKGDQIFVEGELRYRKYTDNQGIERSVAEIIALNLQHQSHTTITKTTLLDDPSPALLPEDNGVKF